MIISVRSCLKVGSPHARDSWTLFLIHNNTASSEWSDLWADCRGLSSLLLLMWDVNCFATTHSTSSDRKQKPDTGQ